MVERPIALGGAGDGLHLGHSQSQRAIPRPARASGIQEARSAALRAVSSVVASSSWTPEHRLHATDQTPFASTSMLTSVAPAT